MIAYRTFFDGLWRIDRFEKASKFADKLEVDKLICFSQAGTCVTVWYHDDAPSQGPK